ncbi:MAG: hypothetical protein QXI89_01140 [Candidatus Anstonellales archaeon]
MGIKHLKNAFYAGFVSIALMTHCNMKNDESHNHYKQKEPIVDIYSDTKHFKLLPIINKKDASIIDKENDAHDVDYYKSCNIKPEIKNEMIDRINKFIMLLGMKTKQKEVNEKLISEACLIIFKPNFTERELNYMESALQFDGNELKYMLPIINNVISRKEYDISYLDKLFQTFYEVKRQFDGDYRFIMFLDLLKSLTDNNNFSLFFMFDQKLGKIRDIVEILFKHYEDDYITLNEMRYSLSTLFKRSNFYIDNIDDLYLMLTDKKASNPIIVVQSFYAWANYFDSLSNLSSRHAFINIRNFMEVHGIRPEYTLDYLYASYILGLDEILRLHEKFNIDYFLRYDKEVLLHLMLAADKDKFKQRPIALAVFNKSDYNGAFYREGRTLNSLLDYFRLIIIEVSSEKEFYQALRDIFEEYGKIELLIIAGHGSANSITLGDGEGEEKELDISDKNEISDLSYVFRKGANAILISCETGSRNKKNIASTLAKALKINVYAPIRPSASTKILVDRDKGFIDVEFDVEKQVYSDNANKR